MLNQVSKPRTLSPKKLLLLFITLVLSSFFLTGCYTLDSYSAITLQGKKCAPNSSVPINWVIGVQNVQLSDVTGYSDLDKMKFLIVCSNGITVDPSFSPVFSGNAGSSVNFTKQNSPSSAQILLDAYTYDHDGPFYKDIVKVNNNGIASVALYKSNDYFSLEGNPVLSFGLKVKTSATIGNFRVDIYPVVTKGTGSSRDYVFFKDKSGGIVKLFATFEVTNKYSSMSIASPSANGKYFGPNFWPGNISGEVSGQSGRIPINQVDLMIRDTRNNKYLKPDFSGWQTQPATFEKSGLGHLTTYSKWDFSFPASQFSSIFTSEVSFEAIVRGRYTFGGYVTSPEVKRYFYWDRTLPPSPTIQIQSSESGLLYSKTRNLYFNWLSNSDLYDPFVSSNPKKFRYFFHTFSGEHPYVDPPGYGEPGESPNTVLQELAAALEAKGWTETSGTTFTKYNTREGDHVLFVSEKDTAGNWAMGKMFIVAVDTTLPLAPTVIPATATNSFYTWEASPTWKWTSNSGVSKRLNNTSPKKYRYKLNNSSYWEQEETSVVNAKFAGQLPYKYHTLEVQERDEAGNWSASGKAHLMIDPDPPEIKQIINSGPLLIGKISGEARDRKKNQYNNWVYGGSGLVTVEVRICKAGTGTDPSNSWRYWNGTTWTQPQTLLDQESPANWLPTDKLDLGVIDPPDVPPLEQKYDYWEKTTGLPGVSNLANQDFVKIEVRARDLAGSINFLSPPKTMTIDKAPPTNPQLTINGGAVATSSATVTLSPSAVGATWVCFQNFSGTTSSSESQWYNLSTLDNPTWTLAHGSQAGPRYVRAKFKDDAENIATAEASIILDATSPNAPQAPSVSPTGWVSGGPWTVSWTNPNDPSGIAKVYYTIYPAVNEPYAPQTIWLDPGANSFSITNDLPEGENRLVFYLEDGAGNKNPLNTAEVKLKRDNSSPQNPWLTYGYADSSKETLLTSGQGYVYPSPYFTWEAGYDSGSGVKGYWVYFGDNPSGDPLLGSYTTGLAYQVSSSLAEGDYYLRVITEDNAGKKSSAETLFTYVHDQSGPTNPQLQINYGAAATSQQSVQLLPYAVQAAQMRFRNYPAGVWSAWETFYSDGKTWVLSSGQGVKTVEAEYKKSSGGVSAATATIILDQSGPSLSLQINEGAQYTKNKKVNVKLTGVDSLSPLGEGIKIGLTADSLADESVEWSNGVATVSEYSLPEGGTGQDPRQVFVRIQDAAGNWSSVGNASIILDQVGPEDSTVITPPDNIEVSPPTFFSGEARDIFYNTQYLRDEYGGSGLQTIEVRLRKGSSNAYRYWLWASNDWTDPIPQNNYSDPTVWRTAVITPATGTAYTRKDSWRLDGGLPIAAQWAEEDSAQIMLRTSDRAGNIISNTADFYVVKTVAQPPVAPTGLGISKSAGEIIISWNSVAGATGYKVYSAAQPYFTKGQASATPVSGTSQTLASPAVSTYYAVASVNAAGESDLSEKRVGGVPFSLVAGHNWVPLLLHNASLNNASALWNDLGTGVTEIAYFNPVTQTYTSYVGAPFGNFALSHGGVYRLNLTGTKQWLLAGEVASETGLFSLVNGHNWLYRPYAKAELADAVALWSALNGGGLTVSEITKFNPQTQTYSSYVGAPFGNFTLENGSAYRINAAGSRQWP